LPSDVYNIYKDTKDGKAGRDGRDGRDGKDGKDGKDGQKGERGPSGTSSLKLNANIDTSINRILTNNDNYAYCLGGTITCNNGSLDKINDDYKYGSTYNYKCSNGTQAYCSNAILESNKDVNDFKFSNSYKGFTVETKDSPYVYDLTRNTITYNNNSYIASEDICTFLTKESHSKNCYMPY
jgi:hypothetical protein